MEHGVAPEDFNSYGARRGNDRVMTRGTFANIRLKNELVPGKEGGFTVCFDDKGGASNPMTIFDAAELYKTKAIPLVVIAGTEYATGSSRDWAAKGTQLLGVRAVIANSFERIHRSNLVGMGVIPLQFAEGDTWRSLGLTGNETYDIDLSNDLQPLQEVVVRSIRPDGSAVEFVVTVRVDTPVEVDYYRNGGILQTVLRKFM